MSARGSEGLSQGAQALAEAVPGLLAPGRPPEEGGQLVPQMHLAGEDGEVGEQGLRLPGRKDDLASSHPRLKPAQQRDAETHRIPLRSATDDSKRAGTDQENC